MTQFKARTTARWHFGNSVNTIVVASSVASLALSALDYPELFNLFLLVQILANVNIRQRLLEL